MSLLWNALCLCIISSSSFASNSTCTESQRSFDLSEPSSLMKRGANLRLHHVTFEHLLQALTGQCASQQHDQIFGVLITTIKNPPMFANWLLHHYCLGFDRIRVYFDDAVGDKSLYGAVKKLGAALPRGRLEVVRCDAEKHVKRQQATQAWTRQKDPMWRTLMANTEVSLRSLWREKQSKGFGGRAVWMINVDGDEMLHASCDIRNAYQAAMDHGSPVAFHLVEEAVYESSEGSVFRARFFKRNLNSFYFLKDMQLMRKFRSKRRKWMASYTHGKAAVHVHPDVAPMDVTQYTIAGRFPQRPTLLGEPTLLHFVNSEWDEFATKMFRKSRGQHGAQADNTPYQQAAKELARKHSSLESFRTSPEGRSLYNDVQVVPVEEILTQWHHDNGTRIFEEHLGHWNTSAGASFVLEPCSHTSTIFVCKESGEFKKDAACIMRDMPNCCMVIDSLSGKKVKYM